MRGQGLRYSIPSIEEPLTRHHLDVIEAQRPLVLIANDVHTAWANTTALERASLLHSPLQENDPDVWPLRVRQEDWDRAFAWRTMRDAGVTIALGSDWPVVPSHPIWGIAGSVNRQPLKPGHNSHSQTLAEAIAGYKRDAAWAEFQEDKKGQIKVGMWADLVLLTEDIFPAATRFTRFVNDFSK